MEYRIDGFHIDMLDQGFGPPYGCWCERYRRQFQAQYGRAMPAGVTWDEDWDRMLEFRYAISARFEKELTAHIRGIRPSSEANFPPTGHSWSRDRQPCIDFGRQRLGRGAGVFQNRVRE